MDGERWWSRSDLLGAALAQAATRPAAARCAGDVPARDPLGTVTALLAAQARGAVPLVRDPAWPSEVVDRQLDLAAGAGRAVPGGPSLMVLPTSGSTAAPRSVLRTARSWLDSLEPFTAVTGITASDLLWAPGGPCSTLTLFALWQALAGGLPVVAGGRWRGVAAAGGAARRATAVHCVPAILAEVVTACEDGRLPALRTAITAGALLPAAVRRRAEACGLSVVEYYGAAELSFVAVDGDGTGLRPFPGVELDLRGGRIRVRSPYLSRGYLDPATPGPWRRDAEGWCGVGDRGSLTGDGVLHLHGRGAEAVSVGGHLVLTADVEAVLGAVDGVAEVVCLGEAHERFGERVVVAVRPADGADPLPAMRRAARARLPRPARPVRYVLLPDFPRTGGGKVARAALRDQVARPAALSP